MRAAARLLAVLLPLTSRAAEGQLTRHGGGCTPSDKSYDYILMVQVWPAAACLKEGCPSGDYGSHSDWTLHGLWPSRTGSAYKSYPCQCDDRSFDINELKPIEQGLRLDWPSDRGDPAPFWAHEWTKHGTCCSDVPELSSEFEYFSEALKLHQSHDVAAALRAASIVPSSSKGYDLQDIIAAIKKSVGSDPALVCFRRDGAQYLSGVNFCLGKDLNGTACDVVETGCDESMPAILLEPAGAGAEIPTLVV